MSQDRCETCGRRACYHESRLEHGTVVSETHYCSRHGSRTWFTAFKDVLTRQIDDLPAELLPPGQNRDQVKSGINGARNLAQVRRVFRPE